MAEPASRLTITPILPHLGARVEGVDLAQTLDEPTFQRMFQALQEYSVLVLHDQRLSDEEQMVFSERFIFCDQGFLFRLLCSSINFVAALMKA